MSTTVVKHDQDPYPPVPVGLPGIVLGVGLGGFFDGIVLHQVLQWHHMFSSVYPVDTVSGLRPDIAPRRLSVPTRLIILGVAVVIHSVLSQLLYAGSHVAVAAPLAELHRGAELMYYGGDLAEMLLAVALVTGWRPQSRRVRPALSFRVTRIAEFPAVDDSIRRTPGPSAAWAQKRGEDWQLFEYSSRPALPASGGSWRRLIFEPGTRSRFAMWRRKH